MKKSEPIPRGPRIISDKELMTPGRVLIGKSTMGKRIPLCDRTIYEMERRGKFPQRVTLGRRRFAWFEDEVNLWISQLARVELVPPPVA